MFEAIHMWAYESAGEATGICSRAIRGDTGQEQRITHRFNAAAQTRLQPKDAKQPGPTGAGCLVCPYL
jgi:hypothetical protein